MARIFTRGKDYDFEVVCPNIMCKEKFEYNVDLSSLPIVDLPLESAELYAAGNRFSTKLNNGDTVFWSLPNGRMQRRMDQYMKQYGQGLATIYGSRLRGIEGREKENINFIQYMGDLDIDDFDLLTLSMEDADCGVDTSVEVECEECGTTQELEIGFGKDFFTRDFSKIRSKSRRTDRKSSIISQT